MNNPFRVLGLDPSAIRGLNDEQIARIVKGVYRALQTVHHPDAGGTVARSVALNRAFEMLDPATRVAAVYNAAKTQFLHKGGVYVKIESLERALETAAQSETILRDRVVAQTIAHTGSGLTVHRLSGKILEMFDATASANAHGQDMREGTQKALHFQLEVREDGCFRTKRDQHRQWTQFSQRRLLGCLPSSALYLALRRTQDEQGPTLVRERVFGQLMTLRLGTDHRAVCDVLTVARFRQFVEHVSPVVETGAFLISTTTEGKEFVLEGRVLKIS